MTYETCELQWKSIFPKKLKKNMIYMYTNRVKCNGNNDFPKILRHAIYKCCDMQ